MTSRIDGNRKAQARTSGPPNPGPDPQPRTTDAPGRPVPMGDGRENAATSTQRDAARSTVSPGALLGESSGLLRALAPSGSGVGAAARRKPTPRSAAQSGAPAAGTNAPSTTQEAGAVTSTTPVTRTTPTEGTAPVAPVTPPTEHFLLTAVKNIGRGVLSFFTAIVNAIKGFFEGLVTGIGGFVTNLVAGNIGEAFSALFRGVIDKAILQMPGRLISGVFEGARQLFDGVFGLMGPVGEPLRWVTTRVLDAGRSLADAAAGMVRDLVRLPLETVGGFVADVARSVTLMAQGRWSEAGGQWGRTFLNLVVNPLSSAAGAIFRPVAAAVSSVGTLVGLESPGRPLTEPEREALREVYGNAVDLDQIRVKFGGLASVGAARTIGNTIYLPSDYEDPNHPGQVDPSQMSTLFHETGHVWQNQNGGGDYMLKALLSQAWAGITGAGAHEAYDWLTHVPATRFEDMNPEQQASVIEELAVLERDRRELATGVTINGQRLTDPQIEWLRDARRRIQQGSGAP